MGSARSTDSISVRPAQARDARALARMASALFEESVAKAGDPFTRSHIPQSLMEVAKHFRVLCGDDTVILFVAESAGRIVGFIEGHRRPPYVVSSGIAEVGYIAMLWVDPGCRLRGTGRELVRSAEAAFRAQGLAHVELHYLEGNGAAEEAWRRLGYRPYRVASFKALKS
jgi:ribosomal protein S18 acetylase RimI-like enzyme